jgi:hypothetical protein
MKTKFRMTVTLSLTIVALLLTSTRMPADTSTCGGVSTTLPFSDAAGSIFFCQIAEAFFSGLTNGTTATTYSPSDSVPREQMAAFITRTQDSALRRGSRRASLGQWAIPTALPMTGRILVGGDPQLVASDGLDLWVPAYSGNNVMRVHASDGTLLGTWTGASQAFGVLVARGRVYVTGAASPGKLYVINPASGPGPVATLTSTLGNTPVGIASDGTSLWTANFGGSVAKIDPDSGATNNITAGFSQPYGIIFDGTNLWVTDVSNATLKRLDANGAILQSVNVGNSPRFPVFDGSNIWVPNSGDNSVTVVRARDGLVLATLTGLNMLTPFQAAFDGERILVTNVNGAFLSMWRATDLTPLGSIAIAPVATVPTGVCSDGINFWVTLQGPDQVARL